MTEETLFAETLRLLRETRRTRSYIADVSGLNVNWLNKLAQGAIKDPSVRKIQRLNAVLKGSDKDAGDKAA